MKNLAGGTNFERPRRSNIHFFVFEETDTVKILDEWKGKVSQILKALYIAYSYLTDLT